MLKKGISFVISKDYSLFIGRELGSKVLNGCMAHLEKNPPFSTVAVDFKNIKFMDFSAADEFLRKLINRVNGKEFNQIYIYLINISALARENIQAALQLNQQVTLFYTPNKGIEVLGTLNPQLTATLKLVNHKGCLTARELADTMNLPINTSSNRLAKLYHLGLINQSGKKGAAGGGQEYIYESVIE